MARDVPDFLSAYCREVAPRSEAPERFHFWTAASAVAGALRRRVWIDQASYRIYCNMYVILVGPPGVVKKSTTINQGTRLLLTLEDKGVHLASDCTTWQAFITEFSRAEDHFADGPMEMPRLADGTFDADALQDALHTSTRAMTCAVSELGTFFDPRERQMVNCLTDLYDAKWNIPWRKGTKTQGTDTIINPFLNLIAGTTPKWLADNFRDQFGGWGLSSRCIFLYCDTPERIIPFPDELWAGRYAAIMSPITETLRHIAELSGPLAYTPEARAFVASWYRAHADRTSTVAKSHNTDEWLSYFLARKQDHLIKLSMILCASRSDSLLIDLDDVRTAADRMEEVERELHMTFSSRHTSNVRTKLTQEIWPMIWQIASEEGGIEHEGMYALLQRYMTFRQAEETLAGFIAAGWMARVANAAGQPGFILSGKAPTPSARDADLRSRILAAQEALQRAPPSPAPAAANSHAAPDDIALWQSTNDPIEEY